MNQHHRCIPRANQDIRGGEKKGKRRTGVNGLLLRLHRDLAPPRNLLSERDGLLDDHALALTNDAARHAPLGRFLRAPHTSRKRELHRARLAHRPREPLRASPARDRADLYLRLAELRVGRRQEDVGHQGELATSAELCECEKEKKKSIFACQRGGEKEDGDGGGVRIYREAADGGDDRLAYRGYFLPVF